jgi:hypothetical protein
MTVEHVTRSDWIDRRNVDDVIEPSLSDCRGNRFKVRAGDQCETVWLEYAPELGKCTGHLVGIEMSVRETIFNSPLVGSVFWLAVLDQRAPFLLEIFPDNSGYYICASPPNPQIAMIFTLGRRSLEVLAGRVTA